MGPSSNKSYITIGMNTFRKIEKLWPFLKVYFAVGDYSGQNVMLLGHF